MKRKLRFVRYLIVVVVIAAIAIPIRFFLSRNNKQYISPLPSVIVELPINRTIKNSITTSAHIEARTVIPVIPKVNGTIISYYARQGDTVKKGDVLAQIDDVAYSKQLLQAEIAFNTIDSNFKRMESLAQAGRAKVQEYEALKAQRDTAKAQYDLAALQKSYARVTSPIDGTILSATMGVGSIGNTEQPVAVVADLSDLVVKMNISEKYFNDFKANYENLSATITKPANNGDVETCNTKIDSIAPYVDGESKTFEVVLKLINQPETFKPGMFIKATVSFSEKQNIASLPLSTRKSDGSGYIFVPDKQDETTGIAKYVLLPLEVYDTNWFAVPKEYAQNYFIVEGQGTVFDGQKVNATIKKAND